MKYTIEKIKKRYDAEDRLKYIFFWGHRPRKDGQISQSCFSQWWEESFVVDGKTYKSAEHWMMAGKAKLFGDEEMLQKIIDCRTPAEAKKLGRKVRNFDNDVWLKNRYEIVLDGNKHKFSQSEPLKAFLLNTGNRVLVEASPYDAIWGVGLAADYKGIHDPNNWKGLNLLGFVLMEVRDFLLESIE